jgi:MscS family membrane protein
MVEWIALLKKEAWMLTSLLILIGTFVVSLLETVIYKKLHQRLVKTEVIWDDLLLDALHLPLEIGIWLIGTLLILRKVLHNVHFSTDFLRLEGTLELGVLLIIAWFFVRFIARLERRMLYRHRRMKQGNEAMTINALCHMARIVIIIILGLSILQLFGIPLAAVVTLSSVSMVAVAYSAKEQLANLFAGLILFWDRPFVVGDWICSPDKEIEGTVEYIGWRLTVVRTFDRRLRYIPNGLFSSIIVENAARMSHRRIKTVIGVRYDDAKSIPKIIAALNEYVANLDEIDQEQPNFIRFSHFGTNSLDIHVNIYTTTTLWLDYEQLKEKVYLDMLAIIAKYKAECAFPTRTVHMHTSS